MANENGQQNGNDRWVPMAVNGSVFADMETEAKKGGMFLKMEPNDQKIIDVLSDPMKGTSSFGGKEQKTDDKGPRTVYRMKVRIVGEQNQPAEGIVWEFGNKQIMQQIVAIVKQAGLTSLVGSRLMLKTSGSTPMNKVWFIMLMPQQPAAPQQPAQSQGNVADPAGIQWLNEQKKGMVPGGA